jgi:uncharacterized protein YkwD
MKNLIIIIALFINSFVNAQTKLDSLVLVKVNQYRTSLGLTKVEFDTVSYLAADNQASYLFKNDSIVGHSQNNIGFETLNKRYIYFGGKQHASIAEICNAVDTNLRVDNDMYLDNLAKLIVDAWKGSFEHNKILIDPKYRFAGASTKVKDISTGIKNWTHYDIKSTMVFTVMK